MDPAEVLALVAVAAVAALLLAGGPAPGASARQFADEYLLAVEETHAGLVEQAHRVDRRLLGLATLAGLVGYAAARLLVEPGVAVWVAVPALAATVGALRLWRAGQDLAPEPGSPVVARVRAVRLADYLPPVGLVVLVASPVLALGCLVAGIEAVRRDVPDVEAAWLVVGLGAAMAVLGVAAPWWAAATVRRPQPSADTGQLYLHDAWRARQLSGALWFQLSAGFVLGLEAAALLDLDATWLLFGWALSVGAVIMLRRGEHTFRRRLWPDLGPAVRVRVGEPAGTVGTAGTGGTGGTGGTP